MSMQPSEDEILREVEALRDIKRRSTAQGGPGALAIDPDLPELLASSSNSHTSPTRSGPNGSTSDSFPKTNIINDPSHLFWVPASLHPEIAPQEFREFLKEHSRDGISHPQSNDPNSLSPDSTKVSRRKSMLSRQYKPSESDGVENEQVIVRRNTLTSRVTPQLTINDLQKLDEIAQAVSEGDDPSKISTMLRRSLSLNTTSIADGKALDMDESDSPIIVPPPNQILRRAARTKIRKPSLQGDGGGHRFPSSRRSARSNTISTTDGSEHDYVDSSLIRVTHEPEAEADVRTTSYTDDTSILDSYSDKRDSLTSSESPGRSEDDHRVTASPPPIQIPPISPAPQLQFDLQSFDLSLSPTPTLTIHEPIPQRQLTIPAAPDIPTSRSPSPTPSDTESTELISSSQPATSGSQREPLSIPGDSSATQPALPTPPTPASPSPSRKDKEKKGLFGKWGGDKKKGKTEVTRIDTKDSREKEKEKEKDSRFFVSLFGGKKKPEESSTGLSHGNTGPAAAATLLGATKANRTNIRTPSPQPAGAYARYPIHVERAIYRLSHIKLANARRPLLEQVLISNLMFWYLSIINKPTTTSPPASQNQTFDQIIQQQTQGQSQEKETSPQERENIERERLERERQEREAKERSDIVRRDNGRKGSANRGGRPASEGGNRRADVSGRGPQYESQYRTMEQEYIASSHNYSSGGHSNQGTSGPHIIRTGSAPPAPMSSSPVYQQYNQMLGLSPQQMAQNRASTTSAPSSQPGQPGNFQYNNDNSHLYHPQPVHQASNSSYVLPPGAMSPQQAFDKSWQNPSSGGAPNTSIPNQSSYVYNPSPSPPSSPSQQRSSHSPPPRQPRSPPPQNFQSNTRSRSVTPPSGRGTRSVSAETFPVGANSGKLKKKTNTIHTSNTDLSLQRRISDADSPGDDVPLAVWQQQHRASSGHQPGASI